MSIDQSCSLFKSQSCPLLKSQSYPLFKSVFVPVFLKVISFTGVKLKTIISFTGVKYPLFDSKALFCNPNIVELQS